MWHYNLLFGVAPSEDCQDFSAAPEDSAPVGLPEGGISPRSMTYRSRSTDWAGEMYTMPEQLRVQRKDSLGATLAAAGLADPDILALAHAADSLVYTSSGMPAAVHSPRGQALMSPRGNSTQKHSGPSYMGRASPSPAARGPSPIYGSKRTVTNSYALTHSRNSSTAGNTRPGSAATSRQGSTSGFKGQADSRSGSMSGYFKPVVSSRNDSSEGYHSAGPSRGTSMSGRKPGNASAYSNNSSGARGHTVSSPRVKSPTRVQTTASTAHVSAFNAAAGVSYASKGVHSSSFCVGERLESVTRSASVGQSHDVLASTVSVGAFPNTLQRRTASLPCWANEPDTPESALRQEREMEHELQAAFEAAVASVHGGLSECSDDERLDVTLASPPSLEALNMAKEMQYAAAAAAAAGGARPQAADPSRTYEEATAAAATPKSIVASVRSGSTFTALDTHTVSSCYSVPRTGSQDGNGSSSSKGRYSSSNNASGSPTKAATAAAVDGGGGTAASDIFVVSSTFIIPPHQLQPATLDKEAEAEERQEATGAALAVEAPRLDGSYNLARKLPVLQEEFKEGNEAAHRVHSSSAVGATERKWWSFGSRRAHPSSTAHKESSSTNGSELEVEQSKPVTSLARNSPICCGSRRCSDSGKDTHVSAVSSYSDKNEERRSKKTKRWMCLLMPLLLLLAASGVFVGLYAIKQLRPKEGAAAAGPLVFQITVAAPANAGKESCETWFRSTERMTLYKQVIASAYSNALDLPASDAVVTSVTCGGTLLFSSTAVRALRSSRPSRHLLGASHRELQQAAGSGTTWVDIVTKLQVMAPADQSVQDKLIRTVSSASSGILAGPLSQFLSVSTLLVKGSELLQPGGSSQRSAAVPGTSPLKSASSDNWLQVPALTGEDHPEAGTLLGAWADSADSNDSATAYLVPESESTELTEAQAKADSAPSELADSELQKQQQQQQKPNAQPQHQQQQPDNVITIIAHPTPTSTTAAPTIIKEPTELQLSTFPWNFMLADMYDTAATCKFSPTRKNSVSDANGRYWSLMDGAECTFRPPTMAAVSAAASATPLTWDSAPWCAAKPTKSNSVLDEDGNLWGVQLSTTCAFRDAPDSIKSKARTSSLPIVWENAPVCSFAPSRENTKADVFGRLWSSEGEVPCAFRYIA